MSYIKATVVTRSDKEHAVRLGGHEIGVSKLRSDADLHANIINNHLELAYQEGRDDFAKQVGAGGPVFKSQETGRSVERYLEDLERGGNPG